MRSSRAVLSALAATCALIPAGAFGAELACSYLAVPAADVRGPLGAADLQEVRTVEIPLPLRHLAELQRRIDRGEVVPRAELEARYFPAATARAKVTAWLRSQGLDISPAGASLAVFASGTLDRLQRAFTVTFARVARGERTASSAVTRPQVPAEIAALIVGVNGLQSDLEFQPPPSQPHPQLYSSAPAPYSPGQLYSAYGFAPTSKTGSAQTIAILDNAFPVASDYATFFADGGVIRTGTVALVTVGTGPASGVDGTEAAIDIEWAGAFAPGANLRIYGMPDFSLTSTDQAMAQIYSDLTTFGTLHQISMSYGAREKHSTLSQITATQQWLAVLAAAGVSAFASSGDWGSQPGIIYTSTRINDPSQPTDVSYPASDPNVTAVGGTSLNLNSASTLVSELAWSNAGGGYSSIFPRPAWQQAPGLAASGGRALPDVAAIADPHTGAIVWYQGVEEGFGGTSVSCPIWAAICADANSARASAALPPIGNFNAAIYPLAGGPGFYDITTGSIGLYSAAKGYDLATGLGTPRVSFLIAALSGGSTSSASPLITTRGGTISAPAGSAIGIGISATVQAGATATYSWQRLPSAGSNWITLVDNGNYSGTGTAALGITALSAGMSGDQFRCVVTANGIASTSNAQAVVVAVGATVTTVAGVPDVSGSTDGVGAAARLNGTWGVVADATGTLYFADISNNSIRKLTPNGTVTTIANPAGVSGDQDGPAAAAKFNSPEGVALDSSGALFIADAGNNAIRKLTPDGTVSTFAGGGTAGTADGTGAAARFSSPHGLAFDGQGNLYVSDTNNDTIREITPAGVVTTLAGKAGILGAVDGVGAAARFYAPRGIAVDAQGNVFVADTDNSAIRKIAPDGTTTTVGGVLGYQGSQGGGGLQGRMAGPYGIALGANGTLYVTDEPNGCILQISPTGVIGTLAGLPSSIGYSDGVGTAARFYAPYGLCFDPSGNLFVADDGNETIRKLVLPPQIAAAPASQTIAANGTTTLAVSASGSAVTYQWLHNGASIPGAIGPAFVLNSAQAASAGQYSVIVSNSTGSVTSASATVTVTAVGATATRLVNLSTSSSVQPNSNLVVGFVTTGGAKRLLIRGVGPTLSTFGVPGALPQPELTLYDKAGTKLEVDDAWGGGSDLAQVFAQVGAFPLPAASVDTAFADTLPAGQYSAQISGLSGTSGVAIAEIYDADSGTPPAHLLNLSASAFVGTGAAVLKAGFVVSGSGTETVLVRGIGPTLASFGLPGALPNTQLTLYDHTGAVIASNTGWAGSPTLAAAMAQVGAFGLDPRSADSALVAQLAPGSYSAQVNGLNGATGAGLIEVYEIPNQ